jgi:Na+-translocating ferredoxin:NAD+ oxidoreductase RnfG subunit
MTVYGVLDEDGKIKEIKISEIILYSQYYDDYELDEEAYTEGLKGKDGSTLSEEDTLISGATISGNAVNKALKDMFGAYEAITKGGNGN